MTGLVVTVQGWSGHELRRGRILVVPAGESWREAARLGARLARRYRREGLTGRVFIERTGAVAGVAVYPPGEPARFGTFASTTRVRVGR